MDVVDAQIHLGPGPVEPTLVAMDALGIRSVLIDELWFDQPGKSRGETNDPGFALPNGTWRASYPVAQRGSLLYPDRFAFFVRVDRRDPDLEQVMRLIAQDPGAKALRVLGVRTREDANAFIDGGFEPLFAAADRVGLPVCVFCPGHVEYLARYLAKFPRLQFVLDHVGMGLPVQPPDQTEAEIQRRMSLDYFDEVLKLAEHPNIVMKLSHAPAFLRGGAYPFQSVRSLIRRSIDAFGADRLIWASDYTIMPNYVWAEQLDYLKLDPDLLLEEKAAILGANARRVFNWPLPA